MLDTLLDLLLDTVVDGLKMLPFLFGAYLLIEFLEHRAGEKFVTSLQKFGKAGALAGAVLGCVPQCGFSVAAANLYANRLITPGTLLAVFISTSDEAVPVLLSHPESSGKILPLLLAKIVLATVTGLAVDFSGVLKAPQEDIEAVRVEHCHCHTEGEGGILVSAILHTLQIFGFLLAVMFSLNLLIELVGPARLGGLLMSGSPLQPVLSALIGLIPNCAASVVIAELYAEGALSFGSAMAGLSSGAGLGLLVLFRTDRDRKECLHITALLFAVSALTGLLLQLLIG
ncbi:MAG TPA: putative manganese transporter [Oscillospiraceae bacterium]|nr:arsenic efflux protein [Oscillospiraceae bacterium]HNW04587.1 putative manganese transporter [Oscillospiraceae bacterium]